MCARMQQYSGTVCNSTHHPSGGVPTPLHALLRLQPIRARDRQTAGMITKMSYLVGLGQVIGLLAPRRVEA